jgi:phage-related protein
VTEVGTGEVPIFPTFNRFRSNVVREVDGAGKESGNRFTVKVKDIFVDGIKGASQLEQSVGAVGAIFKENSGQINAWAASAQTDVGLTANEFNELGSLIGAQLKNGGTAMDQLAPKTNDLIRLGADLSSMFGGDTKTAVEALSSALKGERDPIERYGVSLNQAKIDAEAAALGFEKVDGALSSEANQAATLSLIMQQTADAHGNFASEADTVAGKQQRLNAIWQNGKTAIMDAFLPAVGAVTGFFIDKLPAAITLAETKVDSFVAHSGEIWTGLMTPPDVAANLETPLAGYTAFGAKVRSIFEDVKLFIFNLVEGFQIPPSVSAQLDNELTGVMAFGARARVVFDNVKSFMSDLWTGLQIPASVSGGFDTELQGVVGFGAKVRAVIEGVGEALKPFTDAVAVAFQTGDFTAFQDAFSGFMAIAQPAGPIIAEVGGSIGQLSGQIGAVVAGALPLLTPLLEGAANVMNFLADNTGILTAVIVTLAAGFVAYKAAQAAANVASLGAIPVAIAETASRFALASATRAQTAATVSSSTATAAGTAVERTSLASKIASAAASVRQTASTLAARGAALASAAASGIAAGAQTAWTAATSGGAAAAARQGAAMIASKVAMIAGAAATGIAAAAQWALNAAMSANPIALIVIAIAALVAGLIWFFTQTELGQEIWATFTQFLSEAWANIVAVATTVFTALGEFFSTIWSFIVTVVTTYINLVMLVITTVVTAIVTAWTATWNFLVAVISTVWGFIVAVVTTYINMVMLIITTVVTAIVTAWTATWNFIVAVITAVFVAVVSFVTTYINTVQSVISSVTSAISSVWNSAWSAIGAFFQSVWNAIVSFVTGVVNGIVSTISGFVSSIQSGVNDAIGFITGLPDQIMSILGDLGDMLVNSGEALIQGFIDGIMNMVGGVGDAIGGVMDLVGGFFPNSPAKRGPFSGSGWTRLKKSGVAIGDQFAAGLRSVEPALTARMDSLMNAADYASAAPARPTRSSSDSSSSDSAAAALQIFGGNFGYQPSAIFAEQQKKQRRARMFAPVSRVKSA